MHACMHAYIHTYFTGVRAISSSVPMRYHIGVHTTSNDTT